MTDGAGAPLVVYHFTPRTDFDIFAKGDIGFHFGTQEQAVQREHDLNAENGRIFRAYLNIKNPYRIRLDINAWWSSHIGLYLWSEGVLTDAQWNEIQNLDGRGYDTPGAKRLREMLDEIGIDGFVYPNAVEGDGDSYIVLQDDQIVRSGILPGKEHVDISGLVEQTSEAAGEPSELKLPTAGDIFKDKFSISVNEESDNIVSALQVKAQQYLRRVETVLTDKLGTLLNVPHSDRRALLQDIAREISTEYLQTGAVSQQTVDDLFDRAYDRSILERKSQNEAYEHEEQ